MDASLETIFHTIEIADPESATLFLGALDSSAIDLPLKTAGDIVDQIIHSLSIELSFGREVAVAYAGLINKNNRQHLTLLGKAVRKAEKNGAALGLLMARHFPAVLSAERPAMIETFNRTIDVMLKKGVYTLKPPLEALTHMLKSNEPDAAVAFLDLLNCIYSKRLSYNRTIYLTRVIPHAVNSFSPQKKNFQITALKRVMEKDHHLADPFLEGMEKGLYLLGEAKLQRFVDRGLDKFENQPDLGIKFFSLSSASGIDACCRYQVTANLLQDVPRMNLYLKARIGRPVSARPASTLEKTGQDLHWQPLSVCCDPKSIYLPDEMDRFDSKQDNQAFLKMLLKLEAGLIEFKTFDFDLERVFDLDPESVKTVIYKKLAVKSKQALLTSGRDRMSDLELFLSLFQHHLLATDLFTLFEHARVFFLTKEKYPGLCRQCLVMVDKAFKKTSLLEQDRGFLFPVYAKMAMGIKDDRLHPAIQGHSMNCFIQMEKKFLDLMQRHTSVEASALLAMDFYDRICRLNDGTGSEGPGRYNDRRLKIPFGRQIRPDLARISDLQSEKTVQTIWKALKGRNINVYRSDLRQVIQTRGDQISLQDIAILASGQLDKPHMPSQVKTEDVDLTWLDLDNILQRDTPASIPDNGDEKGIYRYNEWDMDTGDYLCGHVRIREHEVPCTDRDFYLHTLSRYQGLVRRIKYAFELLKPEGLTLLRQWKEGDEFDYRALIDFSVDKKAGLIPSDKLYIKRIKQQRDVAVLLLVDMSRSTANPVAGTTSLVLDVEKEALVLFCEALKVVGDAFAIAGFSGTGPLGVDYYKIKNFHDPLEKEIMGSISALTPKRSTRMGAAIRHGAYRLSRFPAKKRLMIVIGDGFPNDLNYKGRYAIEDTRRAVMEARAKSIHVKAITVNITSDSRLDSMYGNLHHNIISDVRELPDRLLRVYSAITRH